MNAITEARHPEQLDSLIRTVWWRRQRLHLTAGVLAFCRWGVLLFLVGMAIDWMTYMPAPGRVMTLVTLLAVSLYKAWRCGWQHTRAFNATHTALQIEEHHGGLESLLVTAVQFRESDLTSGTSDSMRRVTCRQAEKAVSSVRPEDVVGYHGLRRPFTVMLALALIIGVFAVVNGPFLATGLARIFPPWMAISYPTRTQLENCTGDMIVQEGFPMLIQAEVGGVIPKDAKLALRTGDGKPRIHKLPITDGACEYPIAATYRGFEYRILAGDARSDWHTVEVIASPRIERAQLNLEYPDYIQRDIETVEALTVTVPEGTNIEWELNLDRAVSQANYTPSGGEEQPLKVSAEGRTVTMKQLASESRAYSFSWVDKEHDFSFTSSSHYLSVAPDQSPRVEITSPKGNLYATLGRKLNLAFRGRDDHGIGASMITYRVNKIEEQKVPLTAAIQGDGSEHPIDWDYRTALPNLEIGDSVSFAVELADLYPGDEGLHSARSQTRRITFLSEEDYLAQIAKQKQRLLTKLRNIYREERGVHELVRNLDPSSDVFIQTCQLEAVRQDLMRERLGVLKDRMQDLIDDLAANNITDQTQSATLIRLSTDIENIAQTFVGRAAASLRALATPSGTPNPAAAVQGVDNAARELGCIVLQMGFKEATEVMAREVHAVAQTQSQLRLQTMISTRETTKNLADDQDQLAQWLARLFDALPQDKESTINDALVAFNLSRLVKGLRSFGADTKMLEAVSLLRNAGAQDAAGLQADVIKALLRAEFRLRIGSEHDALLKAKDLFTAQVNAQKKLRIDSAALSSEQFIKRSAELGQAQAALHMKLQLLLMPAIPARRARLFDLDLPTPPPAVALLAQAEGALKQAAKFVHAGDRDKAAMAQQQVETSLDALNTLVIKRIEALTERERLTNSVRTAGKRLMDVDQFTERQLNLLELTEDAADDESDAAHLAQLEQKLVDDVGKFRREVDALNQKLAIPRQDILPLLSHLDKTVAAMKNAIPSLKDNQPDQAIDHQEIALEALENTVSLLEQQTANTASLNGLLEDTRIALAPGPYVADIRAEQLDMVTETREAKPDELPHIAIVQKNLVHAVNAVLNSLEVMNHQVEAGTVMLFAKDDMDAAATAIQKNDLVEAADAQAFVAESMQDLLAELDTITPQYSYILEVSEFLNAMVTQGQIMQVAQNQLLEQLQATADGASLEKLINQQLALETTAKTYGSQLHKATGLKTHSASATHMANAISQLKAGDRDAAKEPMEQVGDALSAERATMLNIMELLANVLKIPPALGHTPDALLVLDVLSLASDQKVLYRKTQLATPEQVADYATQQGELAKRGEGLMKAIEVHGKASLAKAESDIQVLLQFFTNAKANIIGANKSMAQAATQLAGGSSHEAITSQRQAGELQRHFLLAYINAFLLPPGPPPPADPVITDAGDPPETDTMMFYAPGAVSGGKPKGGRQEWEVLGRRDRAALNENFARELPLEYRAILKDYYERLAK